MIFATGDSPLVRFTGDRVAVREDRDVLGERFSRLRLLDRDTSLGTGDLRATDSEYRVPAKKSFFSWIQESAGFGIFLCLRFFSSKTTSGMLVKEVEDTATPGLEYMRAGSVCEVRTDLFVSAPDEEALELTPDKPEDVRRKTAEPSSLLLRKASDWEAALEIDRLVSADLEFVSEIFEVERNDSSRDLVEEFREVVDKASTEVSDAGGTRPLLLDLWEDG